MNWMYLLGAVGIGAVVVKLLDIFWLQKAIETSERRKWLRDQRLKAFSNLSKEFASFGLHKTGLRSIFEIMAIASEAMLLIDDDRLFERIDRFISRLNRFNQLIDKKEMSSEEEEESKRLFNHLEDESRAVIRDLRDYLLRQRNKCRK